MIAGGTVLASEVNDLQMAAAPFAFGEELLEVALGLLDVLAVRQPPPFREAVDVRVEGERRLAERLIHDDARGLVSDAREFLELFERAWHLAAMFRHDRLREALDVARFAGSESSAADEGENRALRQRRHRSRRARLRTGCAPIDSRFRNLSPRFFLRHRGADPGDRGP